jgi:hypothetical protein
MPHPIIGAIVAGVVVEAIKDAVKGQDDKKKKKKSSK